MSSRTVISFDLHKLGWKSFEDLTACIFREVLGQTLQVFADGPDGGRDGAFYGNWSPPSEKSKCETFSGNFTIQCKHTSKNQKSISLSIIGEEVQKIERLAKQGLCDTYFLVTNYSISANQSESIEKKIINAGAKNAKIFGKDWINSIISENSSLRRLVPRIYGLGDLTQIITHQAFRQTVEVLDSILPDLNCFVPTDAYRKSAHALKKHGFVLLIGEPASGKTMIANLLALSAADEWKLQTIMISSPEEFSKYWNPDDPGQFFWVDDAFGSNQYDQSRVHEWNQRLLKLKTAIHKGARVVFTSRDYIFNSAKNHLKISTFELFEDSNVIIEVEKLSLVERQMILYNHLKCGNQNRKFKNSVKPFLVEASNVQKFLPEIARRFGSSKFTKNLHSNKDSVINFFQNPMSWLREIIEGLSDSDRAAIAMIFIEGGNLAAPVTINDLTTQTLTSLGVNLGEVKVSLKKLEGSFIRFDKEHQMWCFKHPTIRDSFASIIGENQEFINIYLAGVRTEQLIEEVTCGCVNLQGAKIIIPESYFDIVIKKLRSYNATKRFWLNPVKIFLASRCSGLFLHMYYQIESDLNFLVQNIGSLSGYNSEIGILNKLHEGEYLPEEIRCEAVKKIIESSMRETSIKFMDKRVTGTLMTESEKDCHWNNLKSHVLSDWDNIVQNIRHNWDREFDPYGEFDNLRSTLDKIIDDCAEKESNEANAILNFIDETIESMDSEKDSEAEYNSLSAEDTNVQEIVTSRCIFDDVDL